jgi:hypothetical protein
LVRTRLGVQNQDDKERCRLGTGGSLKTTHRSLLAIPQFAS